MIAPKVPKPSKADETDAYELVTLRDNNTCQRCHRNCGPPNRDHRRNRSQGGLTVASNLQILGGSGTVGCHGFVTTHPREALEEGWAVPSWAEPAEWPARRYLATPQATLRPAWVLYDNAGDWFEIPDAEAMDRMKGAGW